MKKIIFYLVFTLIFIIPINVCASSIEISCDKSEIAPGGEIDCTLTSKVDDGITFNKLEATVSIVGTSSITFTSENGFTGEVSDKKISLVNEALVNNTTIGTLNIKFSADTTASKTLKLSNIKFYNDEEEVSTATTVEKTIVIKSSEAYLESLTLSECDSCKLTPNFNKDVTTYTVTTTTDQIRIDAKGNSGSSVTGIGLKKLTRDEQTYNIIVKNGDKSVTYKITVKKNTDGDASLKSLTLSKGTLNPKFYSTTTNYTAVVDSDKVVINATANNKKSTIEGIGEKELEYGKNSFNIVVTSPDGTTKTYLLVINRPDNRNANAYLKDLTIDGEDIGFEKDIIDYEYKVSSKVTELEIEAIPEKETSTVEIEGNEDFKEGENIITITVTAEDGSEKIYEITVIKEKPEEVDVYLSDLKIKGYDIKFSKNKFEYTITIKDEKKLDIEYDVEEGYEVEITGNEKLQDGSIIKIIVTDEEGKSNIYKIKVEEGKEVQQEDEEMNFIPIIMISLLGILAVADTILFIKKVKAKDE